MIEWLAQLARAQDSGKPGVSVAVASCKGSVPREAGTRMLVTTSEVCGTIGGGHLEFKAIEIARDMLDSGGTLALQRFPLGASLGQCCGGLVNLLFEPVSPDAAWVRQAMAFLEKGENCVAVTPVRGNTGKLLVTSRSVHGNLGGTFGGAHDADAIERAREQLNSPQCVSAASTVLSLAGEEYFFESIAAPDFDIVLFGAGHVGRALVRILSGLPCRVTWVDSRDDEFPRELPVNVEKRVSEFPEDEVTGARAGSYFLVMTHNHQLDQKLCEQIFNRGDYAYFGMIGSLSKRRQFERRLAARGISPARFTELTCPIGSCGIESKEPMAIAVSVACELLQRRQSMQQSGAAIATLHARNVNLTSR
ncbi:MAG: xanthine dehydrogenase accessory protein XdhC [Betaproteobacteria bacterium]